MSYKEKRNNLLKRHEGDPPLKAGMLQAYRDSVGLLTIGYGHCIERKGITRRAAEVILEDDLLDAENAVDRMAFGDIGEARRAALVSMALNLGGDGLAAFKDMLAALRRGDWQAAHDEALDSKWSKDVDPKQRVGEGRDDEIARMLLTNEWPE